MLRVTALIQLAIILTLVNWAIFKKEKHLSEGLIAYVELAPVDPRSLMQGDYMALRFKLSNDVRAALPMREPENSQIHPDFAADDGFVVVTLDEQRIATFARLYADEELSPNEMLLQYRVRDGSVKFATNAFFFQEGHASYYERARYGQFRVNENGELLLVAMHDELLTQLGPNSEAAPIPQ